MIVNFGLRKSLGSVQYPNFSLPLNDAGSGAVNTTPSRGSGSATFTRAGATATTVLSTGLVSSTIAANTARSYYDPAPVGGQGSYMYLPGVSGAYASTPDSAAVSVTGDIDIRVDCLGTTWATGTAAQYLVSKAITGGQYAYDFQLSITGFPTLRTFADGVNPTVAASTAVVPFANGTRGWLRVTRSSSTGSTIFYTSTDGVTWTQLGTTVSTTAGGQFDGTDGVGIGAQIGGLVPFNGRIYRAQIYNGIGGTLVADFDPTRTTQASTSFAASTGETWTINGRGFIYAAPVYLGYLAEEARTNLCLRSQEFDNASWTKANITATADTADTTSPDGTNNAELLTESTDGGVTAHQVTQAITVSNTTVYTASVWLKAAVRTQFRVFISNATTIAAGLFDLQAGTVGGITGSATIKAYPNGWYRCTVTGTTDSTTSTIFIMPKVAGADYTGNGSKAGYAYGAQLEAGAFATSYIPTAAATSTRAADVMTFPSSGNAIVGAGTYFFRAQIIDTSANRTDLSINDGSNNNRVDHLINATVQSRNVVLSGGVSQASIIVGSGSVGVVAKYAGTWSTNIANAFFNGTAGTLDTSVTVPTSFTNIDVGCSIPSSVQMNGTIRDIRIWQRVLSDSQIASIR